MTNTGKTLFEKRIKICKVCPAYIHYTGQCKKCWCFMQVKARLKSSKCPDSKW